MSILISIGGTVHVYYESQYNNQVIRTKLNLSLVYYPKKNLFLSDM